MADLIEDRGDLDRAPAASCLRRHASPHLRGSRSLGPGHDYKKAIAGCRPAVWCIGEQHHAPGAVSQRPCNGAGDGGCGVRHAEPQQRAAGTGDRRLPLWRCGRSRALPRAGSHTHPAAPGPIGKGHKGSGCRQSGARAGGLQQPDAAVAGGQPHRRRRHRQPHPGAAVAPQPGPQRLLHRLSGWRPQPVHHAARRAVHVPRPQQ